jgi:hypothetical protein
MDQICSKQEEEEQEFRGRVSNVRTAGWLTHSSRGTILTILTWPARCAFTRWDQGKAGEMILYEDQGKVKSQAKKKLSDLAHVFADFSNGDEHDPIPIGGFEVELDAEVSEKDFLSGAAFLSFPSRTKDLSIPWVV